MNKIFGQKPIVSELDSIAQLIKSSNLDLNPSFLFIGPAGLGKTTLVNYFSSQLDNRVKSIQGPLLKNKTDFFNLFATLDKDELLFIDEIHSVSSTCQELLFSLMDKGEIEINLSSGYDSQVIKFKYDNFMLFGATTNPEKLTDSFTSRFEFQYYLSNYSVEELMDMVDDISEKDSLYIEDQGSETLIKYSRMNPRRLQNNLKRINWYSKLNKVEEITNEDILKCFNIDIENKLFLSEVEFKYLYILSGGPNSISVLEGKIGIDRDYIMKSIEPYLLDNELISITSKGRSITLKGLDIINKQD